MASDVTPPIRLISIQISNKFRPRTSPYQVEDERMGSSVMTIHRFSHLCTVRFLFLSCLSLFGLQCPRKMMIMRAKGSTIMGGHVKTSLGSFGIGMHSSNDFYKPLLFHLLKYPQQHCFFPLFQVQEKHSNDCNHPINSFIHIN